MPALNAQQSGPRFRLPTGGNLLDPLLVGFVLENSVFTVGAARDPNGQPRAALVVETATGPASHRCEFTLAKAASPIQYRYSFYARCVTGIRSASMSAFDGDFAGGGFGGVNFETGAVGDIPGSYGGWPTPVMVYKYVGRGWWWIQLVFTTGSHAQLKIGVQLLNIASGGSSYTGDGVSSIAVWGVDLRVN